MSLTHHYGPVCHRRISPGLLSSLKSLAMIMLSRRLSGRCIVFFGFFFGSGYKSEMSFPWRVAGSLRDSMRSKLRWIRHLVWMPPGPLPGGLFWVYPTGARHQGRPRLERLRLLAVRGTPRGPSRVALGIDQDRKSVHRCLDCCPTTRFWINQTRRMHGFFLFVFLFLEVLF